MREEVKKQARERVASTFDKLDLNRNGSIAKYELRTIMKTDPACQPLPANIAEGLNQKMQGNKFFREADIDQDGLVTKKELMDYMDRMVD